MPNEYESPPTGLVLQGDVATAWREVGVLRQLNAVLHAENTRLWLALAAARRSHAVGCLTVTNAAYPCSCGAGSHNARIDAALEEVADLQAASARAHGAAFFAWLQREYPDVWARYQDAAMGAALNESPDESSAATESPGTEPGH